MHWIPIQAFTYKNLLPKLRRYPNCWEFVSCSHDKARGVGSKEHSRTAAHVAVMPAQCGGLNPPSDAQSMARQLCQLEPAQIEKVGVPVGRDSKGLKGIWGGRIATTFSSTSWFSKQNTATNHTFTKRSLSFFFFGSCVFIVPHK